jgi:hypothetical protein
MVKYIVIQSLPNSDNVRQWSINDYWHYIFYNWRAVLLHLPIIENIGHLYGQYVWCRCHKQPKMIVNEASTIMGIASLQSKRSTTASSPTTLVSVRNTRVFQAALTALMEPCTLWQKITHFPSPRGQVWLHTYLHYYPPGIRTIRMTHVLHSSHGLQSCCSRLHNAWQCLCLSSADSHMPHSHVCFTLRFCHVLQ